jgi:hypothetical protein
MAVPASVPGAPSRSPVARCGTRPRSQTGGEQRFAARASELHIRRRCHAPEAEPRSPRCRCSCSSRCLRRQHRDERTDRRRRPLVRRVSDIASRSRRLEPHLGRFGDPGRLRRRFDAACLRRAAVPAGPRRNVRGSRRHVRQLHGGLLPEREPDEQRVRRGERDVVLLAGVRAEQPTQPVREWGRPMLGVVHTGLGVAAEFRVQRRVDVLLRARRTVKRCAPRRSAASPSH